MNNCKNCAKAVFDPVWGDYKCLKHEVVVQPDQRIDCEFYEKGTPALSKRDHYER